MALAGEGCLAKTQVQTFTVGSYTQAAQWSYVRILNPTLFIRPICTVDTMNSVCASFPRQQRCARRQMSDFHSVRNMANLEFRAPAVALAQSEQSCPVVLEGFCGGRPESLCTGSLDCSTECKPHTSNLDAVPVPPATTAARETWCYGRHLTLRSGSEHEKPLVVSISARAA